MCRSSVEVKENRQRLEKRMTDRQTDRQTDRHSQTDRQEKEDGMLMLHDIASGCRKVDNEKKYRERQSKQRNKLNIRTTIKVRLYLSGRY